jgi:hypothetical protein
LHQSNTHDEAPRGEAKYAATLVCEAGTDIASHVAFPIVQLQPPHPTPEERKNATTQNCGLNKKWIMFQLTRIVACDTK